VTEGEDTGEEGCNTWYWIYYGVDTFLGEEKRREGWVACSGEPLALQAYLRISWHALVQCESGTGHGPII
jgi:hypothetical protein